MLPSYEVVGRLKLGVPDLDDITDYQNPWVHTLRLTFLDGTLQALQGVMTGGVQIFSAVCYGGGHNCHRAIVHP